MTINKMNEMDGAKLKEILSAAGLNPRDISEKAGYSRKWLSNMISENRISRAAVFTLRDTYAIMPELYLTFPDCDTGDVTECAPAMDKDAIRAIVKAAVIDALEEYGVWRIGG